MKRLRGITASESRPKSAHHDPIGQATPRLLHRIFPAHCFYVTRELSRIGEVQGCVRRLSFCGRRPAYGRIFNNRRCDRTNKEKRRLKSWMCALEKRRDCPRSNPGLPIDRLARRPICAPFIRQNHPMAPTLGPVRVQAPIRRKAVSRRGRRISRNCSWK